MQPSIKHLLPSIALTPADVQQLLEDPTPQARTSVLHTLSDTYNRAKLSPREQAIAEQIFRVLLRDTEVEVRKALAEQLKENPAVPRDVILALARDVEEVSLPVIRCSDVLSESDLLDILYTKEVARMIAITARPKLSMRLSSALADTREERVVMGLVNNPGAEISEAVLERITKEHMENEDILQGLVSRSSLPLGVVEKLITVVSDTLASQLEHAYQLRPGIVAEESTQLSEKATLGMLGPRTGTAEVEKLVNQLFAFNRLTPSLVVTSLCQGNLHFFEASLARLAHISLANTQALMNDRGELGFRALYAKARLPESFFEAVRLVLQLARDNHEAGFAPGSPDYTNRLVERVLFHAEGKDIENLPYVLAMIRQGATR